MAQLVGARQRTRRLRSSAASERVEAGPIVGSIPVRQLDRGLRPARGRRGAPAACLPLISNRSASRCRPRRRVPSGRRAARAGSLGLSSRRRGSRPCRRVPGAGARAPRRGRCPRRSACRSSSRAPPGCWSPSVTRGVDPQTGAGWQPQVDQPPGRRYEPERRVFRAQAGPRSRARPAPAGRPRAARLRRRAAEA